MTDTSQPEGWRAWLQWTKDQLFSVLPVLAMSLIVLGIVAVTNNLLGKLAPLGTKDLVMVAAAVVVLAALSTMGAALLANIHLDRRLRAVMQDVKASASHLELEAATVGQLIQFLKGEKTWLIDDTEVYNIEASADSSIDVVAPDLYYEEQDDYQDIIANNIAESSGPNYRYLIPDRPENRTQALRVREGLLRRLAGVGISNTQDVVRERFKVHFASEDGGFPFASLHGLALYTWRDGRRLCLQYLPREFGALNVNIPLPGNWSGDVRIGGKVVDAATEEFERLFKHQ